MREMSTDRERSDPERAWLATNKVDRNAATVALRLPIYNNDGVAVGEDTLTASIDDVLATRACLRALETDYPVLFRRATILAPENTVPADRLRILSTVQYGQFTNQDTGEWLEDRRRLLLALVIIVDGEPKFVDSPFIA